MGDISAKIATQRMLAYLVGSSTGIALTQQLEGTVAVFFQSYIFDSDFIDECEWRE